MKQVFVFAAVVFVAFTNCKTQTAAGDSTSPGTASSVAMNPYGKLFTGDGVTVEMAMFADKNSDGLNDVLLKMTGADVFNAGLDGKVIRYVARPGGTGVDFVTQVDGQDYVRMLSRQSWGSWTFFEVYLGGKPAHVELDEKRSAEVKPAALLAEFNASKK